MTRTSPTDCCFRYTATTFKHCWPAMKLDTPSHASPDQKLESRKKELEDHKEKALQKLYSARSPAPIADRHAPTFKPGPAFRKIASGLSEAGFHPLTDRGELASLPAAKPESRQRKIFVRRPGTADPTEMVAVDWSDRQGEIHPLEDISSPKPLLRTSPAYLHPPQAEGTGREETGRRTTDMMEARGKLPSTQVFLPYCDPVKDRSGWQFGLPPREDSRHPRTFSARILTRGGRVLDVKRLRLKRNRSSPSEPVWGWVPAPGASRKREICLSPPEKGPGSQPLMLLGEHDADRIRTPAGIGGTDRSRKPTDHFRNIHLPGVSPGFHEIELGPFEICTAEVRDEALISVRPSDTACRLKLWTSHLTCIAATGLVSGESL